jgi:hypothetical protein
VTFETLPVVHLERRRFPEYPGADTELVLTRLARRFGRVVVVDAGGIRTNNADLEFIQESSRKRLLWMDAGSRYATDAMDLFVAGAETVTLRWNTIHSAAELEEAAGLAQEGSLLVGIEFPRGRFLPHPRDPRPAEAVVELAQRLGVGVVYVADRPDPSFVRALPGASTARWLQGGDGALAAELQSWGYHGALVGPVTLEGDGATAAPADEPEADA